MENTYKVSFRGDGKTLFKIWIVNLFLTVCTLGIYYPWARANMKRYLYSSTYLGDYSFEFHGTGKQMFFGMMKFLIISMFAFIAIIIASVIVFPEAITEQEQLLYDNLLTVAILIFYAPILALFVHGARKYRMSRTSYRGIKFGYRGNKKPLVLLFLKGAMFTAITFGIYYPWFVNNIRKYIYSNTRFGNIEAGFNGKGSAYAGAVIPGWFFTYLTLGIYYYWLKRNLFKFFYENLSFSKEGEKEELANMRTTVTAGKFFKLISINWLIILFTLGLGYPIAKVRTMHFIADNLELYGNLDLDDVIQTETNYINAMGDAYNTDDSSDFFDLDIF